jgi:hypothetical protein
VPPYDCAPVVIQSNSVDRCAGAVVVEICVVFPGRSVAVGTRRPQHPRIWKGEKSSRPGRKRRWNGGKWEGKESGEGRRVRCGAMQEASKDEVFLRSSRRKRGRMQHTSGGIDRFSMAHAPIAELGVQQTSQTLGQRQPSKVRAGGLRQVDGDSQAEAQAGDDRLLSIAPVTGTSDPTLASLTTHKTGCQRAERLGSGRLQLTLPPLVPVQWEQGNERRPLLISISRPVRLLQCKTQP